MKIIFHLGPHKTGSTSIQHFLQHNSALLRESGVLVPTPLTDHPGHHEIPWSEMGWDLKILGSTSSEISLEDYVDGVLREAKNAHCSTLVFSSEDLSLLDLDQWSTVLALFHSRASQGGGVNFQFVSVNRERDGYVASQYKTLVLLGLSQKFDAVKVDIESHFENVHQRLRQISGQYADVSEVTEIPYVRDDMVSVFMNTVFPAVEVPDDVVVKTSLNSGYHDDMIEILREWNASTGIEFDNTTLMYWPTFHTLQSITRLTARRHQLFGAYDSLLGERSALASERDFLSGARDSLIVQRDQLAGERDALAAERNSLGVERDALATERNALLNSNSWKLTRPLRAFGRLLRREPPAEKDGA